MTDFDLGAIAERSRIALSIAASPVGPMLDAWVASLHDVPALVAEIERMRAFFSQQVIPLSGGRTWTDMYDQMAPPRPDPLVVARARGYQAGREDEPPGALLTMTLREATEYAVGFATGREDALNNPLETP
jgi:hypothetical protein